MTAQKTIKGNIVDLENRKIFFGEIQILNNTIQNIIPLNGEGGIFILPGFIDAHIHIESSMLVPSEFARIALEHGTVSTVSDPHEIANVLGVEGVRFMINNGNEVPLKFNFGAPSCVPATKFETAGAEIDSQAIAHLLNLPEIKYLAEVMNYPGVLYRDKEVMQKIASAKSVGKPIDGHAPGLRGEQAKAYIDAGISTDHECFTYEEAREKIEYGMKILIREGSAAKNYNALIPLLGEFPSSIMFCSDDKHPDDLLLGHINLLVKRALNDGYNLFDVLRAACYNPVFHYNLDVGLLRKGDPADFITVNNLKDFVIQSVFIEGQEVVRQGSNKLEFVNISKINHFNTTPKAPKDFEVKAEKNQIKVIKAIDGEIITESFMSSAFIRNNLILPDLEKDILKVVVVNRYSNQKPSIGFINGFNLKIGALASSVAHDSHNIIAVGTTDEAIAESINLIIEHQGGISAVMNKGNAVLPLPIAGIMSDKSALEVGEAYSKLDKMVKKDLGCTLKSPFMTLSFMALLVIPKLKLSDKGLFDGSIFKMTSLFR